MATRILCVDDEQDICRLLDTILTMNGYRTLIAASAAEGLSQIRLRPDLVILDINLPDLDGIEACRRLRRLDARVPVLFLTAAPGSGRAEALAAGGDAFLEKPFDVEELLRVVERLLAQRDDRRRGGERRVRAAAARAPERRSAERRAPALRAAAHRHGAISPSPRPIAREGRPEAEGPSSREGAPFPPHDARARLRES